MEGETIAIVVSCVVSGLMLIWKLIKKFRKSKCYIENEKGEKIVIDFGIVEKEIEEQTKELSKEQREKLKQIALKALKKIPSSPTLSIKENL